MRILHVTLGFYPAEGWGGPVKTVHQNGRELVRRGHEVTVYCTNLFDKARKIQPGTFERTIDGLRVVYFDTWRLRHWPGTLGPFWLPELPAYLRREIGSFDVVHLNGYRCGMLLCAAKAARAAGVPVVTQPHGTLPVIVNSFFTKRLYDRFFGREELRGISALLALQAEERLQALEHGVDPNVIEIIPNGISTEEYARIPRRGAFRERLGISTSVPVILFLARINKKKGADMLLQAFHQMGETDVHLVIAGPDDGHLTEVKRLIAQLGLEKRVSLPGLLSGDDVYAAYGDSDLFVLPCRADTFPFAIIEAALAEKPMVVTDRCEMAGMLENRVADVVPFDARAFGDAMRSLLKDRNKYERYRRNCRTLIEERFSIQAVVDRLEEVYRRVAIQAGKVEVAGHAVC